MRRSAIVLLLLLCLLLCLLLPSLVTAARSEFTGFESGSVIECTGTTGGTFSFDTTTKYTGTYALHVSPIGAVTGYCGLGIISGNGVSTTGGTGPFYTVFRFLAASIPSGTEDIYVAEGASSTMKLSVRLTSTGKLQAYDSTNTQLGTDSTTTLSAGTWYLIGVKAATGATGAYEVTINGSVEMSGTGNLSTQAHAQRVLGKRTNQNSKSVDFYYDDVVIDTVDYPAGNMVVALHPNANGSTMQWTAGTGASNYTQVNEVVPSTIEYVQSVAQNNVALFTFESLPAGTGTTVAAVKTMQRVAEVTSGTTTYAVRIRSGGVNSNTTTADVGSTAYATRSLLLETDPATSVAWTTAAVNLAEAGGVDSTTTPRLRLAWVVLMVEVSAPVVAPTGRARVTAY
jgi:hypothetical protein